MLFLHTTVHVKGCDDNLQQIIDTDMPLSTAANNFKVQSDTKLNQCLCIIRESFGTKYD